MSKMKAARRPFRYPTVYTTTTPTIATLVRRWIQETRGCGFFHRRISILETLGPLETECSRRHTGRYSQYQHHHQRHHSRHFHSECRSVDFDHVKQGHGTIVATATTTAPPKTATTATTSATTTRTTTRLSTVSHKAPLRLVPTPLSSRGSSARASTAATSDDNDANINTNVAASCSWSHYGGGMAAGDQSHLTVHVQPHALLHLHTQGSNRIYKPPLSTLSATSTTMSMLSSPVPTTTTQTSLRATLDAHAGLIYAPDPTSLHTDCRLHQTSVYTLHPTSHLVAVDWISAGRLHWTLPPPPPPPPPPPTTTSSTSTRTNSLQSSTSHCYGERWDHDHCTTRTTIQFDDTANDGPSVVSLTSPTTTTTSIRYPSVIDAQTTPSTRDWLLHSHHLDHTDKDLSSLNHPLWQFNAFCTVYLYGSKVHKVMQRFELLQPATMAPYTSVRTRHSDSTVLSSSSSVPLLNDIQNPTTGSWMRDELSGGRVVVGVTRIPPSPVPASSSDPSKCEVGSIVVCRLATTTNEDMYRLLRYGLQPLLATSGIECYQNRTFGSQSAPPPSLRQVIVHRPQRVAIDDENTTATVTRSTIQPRPTSVLCGSGEGLNVWLASLLTDSALPTGSFAHSLGLEVTQQLGLLIQSGYVHHPHTATPADHTFADSSLFVQAVVQSTMQLAVPFITASWSQTNDVLAKMTTRLANTDNTAELSFDPSMDMFLSEWMELQAYTHAMLVSNGPACAASLDQGTNLLRVATHLVGSTQSIHQTPTRSTGVYGNTNHQSVSKSSTAPILILQHLERALSSRQRVSSGGKGVHMAPVFGLVTRLLDVSLPHTTIGNALPPSLLHVFGYCVARDVISSAVRLNLLGPLAGQSLLYHNSIQQATQRGISLAQESMMAAHGTLRRNGDTAERVQVAVAAATGSAPILDVVHPCHDSLATRLFRT